MASGQLPAAKGPPITPAAAGAAPTAATTPLTALRGVGPERAVLLARLELHTVADLFRHRPRRYEDRRRTAAIRDLVADEAFTVRGRVIAAGTNTFRSGRSAFKLVVDDGTARLHCQWWNLPFLERVFAVGDELLLHGKVRSLRPRLMEHPETEKVITGDEEQIHLNRVVPVYPLTEGLPQRVLRALAWQAVERFADQEPEPDPDLAWTGLPLRVEEEPGSDQFTLEPLPVLSRAAAIRALHFPTDPQQAARARQRLALDEFAALQLTLQRRRRKLEANAVAWPCGGDNRLMRRLLAGLPFRLTPSQGEVLRTVRQDLAGAVPMRRLLQGDVGSGKTVVAICTALMALESGFNVVVMAPTEILADQLGRTFRRWLGPLGVAIQWRTGSRKTDEPLAADLPASGESVGRVIVGTHALLEGSFQVDRLGLVIIDEQHKFGVSQREQLLRKGRYPHLLVMTATPIPRTLGLTLYGDLDLSVLRDLPAGRRPIRTHLRDAAALPKVWAFIRKELEAGRQAYVIYPRVNESDRDDVKAVTREHARVQAALAPHRVGLLHGQMRSEQKDAVMTDFAGGLVSVLVATGVVEVGVDVPNASVMVIENAEQFGLAQLHQLRGRIGRGRHASHCILVAQQANPEAQERLRLLAATSDGFVLAEEDLRRRGPGDLVGRQQSGLPDLRFGDLGRDGDLLAVARERVREFLNRSGETRSSPA